MKTKIINGIKVTYTANIPDNEVMEYIKYVETKSKQNLIKLGIIADGDFIDLSYEFGGVKFDRIRRITGYIVPDLNSWGNAKLAELHDRVKHGIEGIEKI